jgi:6-phosphogluconolactonase
MGGDGHTASIFPGTLAVKEKEHRVVGYFAENSSTGKSWRITMTAPFINRSAKVLLLVTGASKAARLAEILHGPRDPKRLPIQLIDPASGQLIWMLDEAAAKNISAAT